MKATECNESTVQRCAECGEVFWRHRSTGHYLCLCDGYVSVEEITAHAHADERVVQGEDGRVYVVEVSR